FVSVKKGGGPVDPFAFLGGVAGWTPRILRATALLGRALTNEAIPVRRPDRFATEHRPIPRAPGRSTTASRKLTFSTPGDDPALPAVPGFRKRKFMTSEHALKAEWGEALFHFPQELQA
ncbi:MAG: hypothetical protein KF774_12120, partial [Planctomyces sp.]|nr:hypothetical protein [Planctomyces sp.]